MSYKEKRCRRIGKAEKSPPPTRWRQAQVLPGVCQLAGGEELANTIHPGFGPWIVVAGILPAGLFKLAQQLLLAIRKVYRGLDYDMAK